MPDVVPRDECTPIAQYIAGEMNRNIHSQVVRKLRGYNTLTPEVCLAEYKKEPLFWRPLAALSYKECMQRSVDSAQAALLLWAWWVRPGGEWDHKPKIKRRFRSRVSPTNEWHVYGEYMYRHDVWSNIHCGYVGSAAKFDDATLLDGAGFAQIFQNLARGLPLEKTPGLSGMRAFDGASDTEAITVGIRFYRQCSSAIVAADVLREVSTNPKFVKQKVS